MPLLREDTEAAALADGEQRQRKYASDLLSRSRELRVSATSPERTLWQNLRGGRIGGCKFRRQQPIGRFIVDFYCADLRLAIELDGDSHVGKVEYDLSRQRYLETRGITVLRFCNMDVNCNLPGVLQTIYGFCRSWKKNLNEELEI
jgi:very-short-patch-repair endonuclease